MLTGIADTLDELGNDSCRAVVLQSAGRHFCAGADLMAKTEPSAGPLLYDVVLRLFEAPIPIIAAVQGAAIGGGLGLALTADFRIASPEARFAATFARLGTHHGFGMTATLPLVVGFQTAQDLLYTGRRIDGAAAARLGLVDRLVPAAGLRAAALDLAADIASAAPLAVAAIRSTLRGPLRDAVRRAVALERDEQQRLSPTADFHEGVLAAAERRSPVFHGR